MQFADVGTERLQEFFTALRELDFTGAILVHDFELRQVNELDDCNDPSGGTVEHRVRQ